MKRLGLIFLLLFSLAVSGLGQTVAFDAASGSSGTGVSTLSWSHTCTGRGLSLVVAVAYNGYPFGAWTGVSYAGHALTAVPSSDGNFSTYNICTRLYILASAPNGTGTITVTSTYTVNLVAEAVSFTQCTGIIRGLSTDAEFGASIPPGFGSTQQFGGAGDMQVVGLCFPSPGTPPATSPLVLAGVQSVSNVAVGIYYKPYPSATTSGFVISTIPGGGYLFGAIVVEQGTFAPPPASGSLASMGVGR